MNESQIPFAQTSFAQMPFVIPAAGLGSRLFPATWAIPKELFPVGNRPALHYLLEEAKCAALHNVICITSPRKEALSSYLNYRASDNAHYGLTNEEQKRLEILEELNKSFNYSFAIQEQAKGVGNALLCVRDKIGTPFFAMAYPDDLLEHAHQGMASLMQAHELHKCAVIAVERVAPENISAYGVIVCGKKIDNHLIEIQKIVEKPPRHEAPSEYGIVGRYIVPTAIFESMTSQNLERPCFVQALNSLIANGTRIIALVLQTTRYDIGTVPGWLVAVQALNRTTPHMPPFKTVCDDALHGA